ncbi:MAG TPA: pyridoxamine 5'-phosphate oxidase family protein [Actinomycetota bacterium]|nr:pyridoxamine 5'-phosphate oxidase family protein [Actinomycetota bacterium]
MPLAGRELKAFLEEVRLAHWATVGPDGGPKVRPVWYVYEDASFWFTTRLESRRTGADITDGSPVAVSIADDNRPYRAVLAYGTPQVWAEDRERWLERIATRYGAAEGRRWLAGALKEPDRVVLRLEPEKVLSWHYGTGDYGRLQKKASLRVDLP